MADGLLIEAVRGLWLEYEANLACSQKRLLTCGSSRPGSGQQGGVLEALAVLKAESKAPEAAAAPAAEAKRDAEQT